ncbi:MAG: M20/M25/M40 family metallo-hydrolase [bacterium]
MQKKPYDFLLSLLECHSPSGHEAAATRVWLDYVTPFADEVMTDAYGNAFAVLNPKAKQSVMFDGHSDEVGMMVTYIDEDGYLWVSAIGGIDPKVLPGMRVLVHAPDGDIRGVVGTIAPHMQTGELATRTIQMNEIYVDIGAKDKADAGRWVRPGVTVTIDHGPVRLLGDTLCARACDNRIGIWSSAEGLRRCRAAGVKHRVIACSNVQEEIGLHGAAMAAYRWDPDVCLVVDVGNSTDFPDTSKQLRNDIRLGAGPCQRIGSAAHPAVVDRLDQVAAAKKINLQRIPIPVRSGTNAGSIYISRKGIPCGILSTPNRYMHSPSETIDLKDLDAIPTLMTEFVKSIKPGETFTVHKGGRLK